MKHKLNIDTWARKEHFNFFRGFEEPFYGVVVNVDCTRAYTFAKDNGVSFFLYYLHKSLTAINELEPFKYRIYGDEVFVYDRINAGPTIGRANGTFGFGYIDFHSSLDTFIEGAKKEIERVQTTTTLFAPKLDDDIVHYSAMPWIDFTSLSHARSFSLPDSCPKISFGKMTEDNRKKSMPVSLHVNHALVDGMHVGQYYDLFQQLMSSSN
ncbi:chloramphenicol O-acetyltransferase type A [Mucilaginibacter lappiensis]|uniref:Chloramphenicol O-acetyltransferase type A n=1 Tax=Mucilaginibacter lappiensis TaxID=354630 RepID=A0ABR6PJR7_9SPHI|nr:chloramphenicol acetyltransferase [Mucilaginibacter lappiensis]MBB6109454.1 chloramphenicol O-acetyltransferase type A [Mucilaginibacter lappiensis]SIQ94705.1 chloramphenicol O-acetyltransferase type A [Mucilaginibacter lappiensis]